MDIIGVSAGLLLLIDGIYLSLIGGPQFSKTVSQIQNSPMKINKFGAIGSYVLLIFLLNVFILQPRYSPYKAFLLGFGVYGVFDFTNYAIFSKYDLIVGLLDMIWGGCLFYMVTKLTYHFEKKKVLVKNK